MSVKLHVIHHDDHILVINKPGGLLSIPGKGPEKQDCVVARARSFFPDLPAQPAVHRLDLHTSGIMLLARTKHAHRHLVSQFQYRKVVKRYIAILDGSLAAEAGSIELAFRLDPENRPYQVLDPLNGKSGITLWHKLSEQNGRTRIEFTPLTGRTHQLRLHAAHDQGLGVPIVGDFLYGNGEDGDRMLLHSAFISFTHPGSSQTCEFTLEPPF
ncbi:MAG: RluA family pseudouridine synthase [Desulfobacterales bacterium]|nr:RluA family pseudouridine synthase [Desulfobacterales bacterium]